VSKATHLYRSKGGNRPCGLKSLARIMSSLSLVAQAGIVRPNRPSFEKARNHKFPAASRRHTASGVVRYGLTCRHERYRVLIRHSPDCSQIRPRLQSNRLIRQTMNRILAQRIAFSAENHPSWPDMGQILVVRTHFSFRHLGVFAVQPATMTPLPRPVSRPGVRHPTFRRHAAYRRWDS
jgi:hypothetical protein